MAYGGMSPVCTLQEYRMNYANPKRYRILTVCLITGYLLVGILVLTGLKASSLYLLDAALCLGLLLGVQWKKSKGCARALLVISLINMALGLLMSGVATGWPWVIVSGVMVWNFRKMDAEYDEYRASVSNRYDPNGGYYRFN